MAFANAAPDISFVPGVRTILRSCRPYGVLATLLAATLVLIIALFVAASAQAAADAVPGELIVGFDKGVTAHESRAIVNQTNATIDQRLPGKTAVVSVDGGLSTAQAAQKLQAQDGVAYAEPNYVVHSQAWTNDAFLTNGTLWGLISIKAPTAWNVTRGDGVNVAVVDSGITADNPDLTNNVWQNPNDIPGGVDSDNNGYVNDYNGWDWVHSDNVVADEEGHGTHVSGTIAATANDGNPMVGVAPGAHIMALKFLDSTGSGNVGDAISAIDYAIKNGASVINASWGGPDYSAALQDAIKRAGDAGVVFVAAAGNDSANNDTTPTYPAAYNLPNELSVAATDAQGQLASFSNYGTGTVDVAAPGVDIYSTVGDHYESWSGTSMATPFVSGVAALLKSAEPGAGAAQIADAIRAGAHPLPSLTGKVKTGGEVDAVGALAALGHSPLSATDPPPGVFRLKTPGTRVYAGGGSKVSFSWSRASDADLVGYEVYLDGKLKATVNDPDGSQGPLVAGTSVKIKVSAGRHRWNVTAVDEAGNTRMAGRGKNMGRVAVLSRKH